MLLNEYVPKYLLSKTFKTVYEVQQTELNSYNKAIENIKNQCFIDTATWGLKYWEQLLDIPTDTTRPYDFRRSVIKAKIRGQGTVTVSVIKNVAESFTNGEVEITENIKPYTFEVKFVGTKGIPPNIDDLKESINEIKPAHLLVEFKFTFNTWQMVSGKTWAEVSSLTWEQLRTI